MAITRRDYEELVVLLTHNDNGRFKRHTEGYISENIHFVPLNDDETYNNKGKQTLEFLISSLRSLAMETPYNLITLVIDFNMGYSSYNTSPVKEIINRMRSLTSIMQYEFVNTTSMLAEVRESGKTPFRFILTGTGGFDPNDEERSIELITSNKALSDYGFNSWSLYKYMGAIRRPEAPSPSPVPRTPVSTRRRLTPLPTTSPLSVSGTAPVTLPPTLPVARQIIHALSSSSSTGSASTDSVTTSTEISPSADRGREFADFGQSPVTSPASSSSLSPLPHITRSSSENNGNPGQEKLDISPKISQFLAATAASRSGFFDINLCAADKSVSEALTPVQEESPLKKTEISPPNKEKDRGRPNPIYTPRTTSRRLAPANVSQDEAAGATEIFRQLKF
jgi:hypothetical protein